MKIFTRTIKVNYKKEWDEEEKWIKSIPKYNSYYTLKNHMTSVGQRQDDIEQEKLLQKLIPRESKLLDIGCSYGRVMRLYPNSFGIDVSKGMLKRNPFKNRIKQMDASQGIYFNKKTFDNVVISRVLNHLQDEDIIKVLDEADSVLREGGTILIDISKKVNKIWFIKKIFWWIKNKGYLKPISSRCVTIKKMRKFMKLMEFEYKIHLMNEKQVMFEIFKRKK